MLAKIVYATMTGNTEEISEILEEEFQQQGVEVIRMEADDADDADEEAFTDAIFVLSRPILTIMAKYRITLFTSKKI